MWPKVVGLCLWIFLKGAVVEGYTWDVPLPLGVSICSETTSKLYLNWTYAPATPLPFSIEWSKIDSSGASTSIARFTGTTFQPLGSYMGRVSRAGSTAEIVINGPFTTADAGLYQVTVSPTSGPSLSADEDVPNTNVTKEPIMVSSMEENTFDFTVTCTLGSPTNLTLQFWDGNTRLEPDTVSASAIIKTIPDSSGLTLRCSVTGQGSDCRTSNIKYETLPVSSFVTTSLIFVIIIIVLQLILFLLVFFMFHYISSVKLTAEDDLAVDHDLCKKLFGQEIKGNPVIRKNEAHVTLKKSVKAKEIIKKSVQDRRIKIVPKRDDRMRKWLWIMAVACGVILILIAIIFISLKAAKCNRASSDGIFIGAVLVSVLGLIFGIAVLALLFYSLRMGGERK